MHRSPIRVSPSASVTWLASGCLHSSVAERDAPFGEVVGRQLHFDAITGQDAYVVFAHTTRDMCGDDMTIIEFNAKHGVGQGIDNLAL